MIDLKNIAPFVEQQFPAFYKEDGPNFIQFVKAYYEWLDEQGPIFKSRRLFETTDIDDTAQQYIDYFMKKYMEGIPSRILANKRLLEKHILDVYRAKGSIEGLKLLFRILYNEEIDVYVPEVDMIRASHSTWLKRSYLEVAPTDNLFNYDNQFITGSTSGATAFVSTAAKYYLGNQIAYVLYLSDINEGPAGTSFLKGEYVTYDGLNINDATFIRGSAVGATVDGSTELFQTGDVLATNTALTTSGEDVKYNVSALIDPNKAKGFITFRVRNGGYGYTINPNITITYGSASTGTGAAFKVGSLSNTSQITINNNYINQSAATLINAPSYGTALNNADVNTILQTALNDSIITVGSIATLTAVTSGDKQYNGTLNVRVQEPLVSGYGFYDDNGGLWGDNAVITGAPSAGNGVVSEVRILSSGFGFHTQGESIDFFNEANNNLSATLLVDVGGVGVEEGQFLDETGFMNADKYMQDSYYYQEYSYEIRCSRSLDKYFEVLKKVMHPVGNKVFGKPVIAELVPISIQVVNSSIVVV